MSDQKKEIDWQKQIKDTSKACLGKNDVKNAISS